MPSVRDLPVWESCSPVRTVLDSSASRVWSDTVNTASRMESSGAPGRIQVTEETYRRLSLTHRFECRGQIDVKGKGPMTTYFLIGRQSDGMPSGSGASRMVPD